MSLILLEPSETKVNSRLPQSIIQAGRVLNGLEESTGADILLSPLSIPIKDLSTETGITLLKRHIEAGLLIQRKTSRDAVSSIPHYPAIQQRMMEWSKLPLLITIGEYSSDRDGKVICDNKKLDWSWNAYLAALDWWQLRGGLYVNLSQDRQLLPYLNMWLERLGSEEWNEGTVKHIINHARPVKQVLGKPDWTSTVMGLGIGFGPDKAIWLTENFRGMGDFLVFFSDERNVKSSLVKESKGIGPSHFKKTRDLLALYPKYAMEISTEREMNEE